MWNCRSHTLLFENWTIRLDVGRKWDTLVPLPDPLSSTFWPCPLLNCLCSEEWLWASEDDLSNTKKHPSYHEAIVDQNDNKALSSPQKVYSLKMTLAPKGWINWISEPGIGYNRRFMIYAVMGTRRIVDCSSLNISSYDTRFTWFPKGQISWGNLFNSTVVDKRSFWQILTDLESIAT